MREEVKKSRNNAEFFSMQKEENKTLFFISHYQFHRGRGMQSVWILFWDFLELKKGVIPYFLW
jgi:hypothetical protein